MAPREAFANDLPGIGQVACNFLRKISPKTFALRGGPHVMRRADPGMVDIDMLRRVLRVGGGGEQEFAEPAFPGGGPVDQLVTDHEYGLRLHGEDDRQDHAFPGRQRLGGEDLPHAEYEGWRPQQRPDPDREIVPKQAALGRARRIHVAPVDAKSPIERARDAHEEQWRQQPPAAIRGGKINQGENAQWQIMRKRVKQRWLDTLRDVGLVGVQTAAYGRILRHGSLLRWAIGPACRESPYHRTT